MKRKFRKFQEGGEVDIPRRKPMRDQYGNIVRSGTGEPIMTAGEMDENDLRELNPEAMTGFEGSVRTQAVPPPPPPPPPGRPTVNAPLAPRPGTGDAEVAQYMAAQPREDRKAAGASAPQSRPPAPVSAPVSAASSAASSAARPPAPPFDKISGGGRGIAAGKTAAQEAMLTGGGRGKEAAKTAVQGAIGSGRGKYPGKTAEQEAMLQKKLKDKEVPSVDEIRAQNARTSTGTSAKEKIEAGSSDLLTKALAVPAVGAAGYGIKKGIDLLRRRKPKPSVKPGDRKEPKLGMNKGGKVTGSESYWGSEEEVKDRLAYRKQPDYYGYEDYTPSGRAAIAAYSKAAEGAKDMVKRKYSPPYSPSAAKKAQAAQRETADAIKRETRGTVSEGRYAKGGRVQKAPSPPDMGSSKYEPDLNKPKPKKKAMSEDMDMFMARSGGLAKKIDGIALRGKTRGKMY